MLCVRHGSKRPAFGGENMGYILYYPAMIGTLIFAVVGVASAI